MPSVDPLAVVHRRLHASRLAGAPLAGPGQVVRWLGAMQAQEHHEAKWSLAQRAEGDLTDAAVEGAFARGELLRTHVLRPTWHYVAPEDIRWIQRLTAPRVHRLNRYWYAHAGLDGETLARGQAVVERELAAGEPRTRSELAAALAAAGIEAAGPRLAYVLMHAELEELICSGPRRGRRHTYALLDHRARDREVLTGDRALGELAQRYFTSHGPATLRDFTWWSSLTTADARTGIGRASAALEEIDEGWWAVRGGACGPVDGVLLLGMYDETIVGHKDLRIVLAREPPREGLIQRVILADGRTVGSWRRTLSSRALTLEATVFAPLSGGARRALHAEAERFGAFHGLPCTVVEHRA